MPATFPSRIRRLGGTASSSPHAAHPTASARASSPAPSTTPPAPPAATLTDGSYNPGRRCNSPISPGDSQASAFSTTNKLYAALNHRHVRRVVRIRLRRTLGGRGTPTNTRHTLIPFISLHLRPSNSPQGSRCPTHVGREGSSQQVTTSVEVAGASTGWPEANVQWV